MSPVLRPLLLLLVAVAAVWVLRPAPQPAVGAGATAAFVAPTPASRARSFTFAGVAPGDQQAVLQAVDAARPEARRLIDAIAGLVTVQVGSAGPTSAGTTQATPAGYELVLDLGLVNRTLGRRGIDRLVLHELGHVVEFALVPEATLDALDKGVPRGYGCDDGRLGACAGREERFAESFAKWASGDIGVDLSIGYKVLPPVMPLETWAEPLTRLALPAEAP